MLMDLYFKESGTQGRPVILFIHGIGAGEWMWTYQSEAFSDYHCIAVDLPEHGKSREIQWISLEDTGDKIARIIEERATDQTVHLVGLSLGGNVVMEMLLKHLSLADSAFVSGIAVSPVTNRFAINLQARMQAWSMGKMRNNESRLNKVGRDYYKLNDSLNEVFKENVRQMNIETYKEIVREVFKLEVDDKFQHVTVPVKVLAGSRESRAIRNSVTAFPKVMPNAEGKIIDDEVHAWNIINPYKFNVELRNWLDRA